MTATPPDTAEALDDAPRLRERLLAWYAAARRDLPWRRTRDPYRILVSEVMLQQTQVERVVPKYHEFLARFPTLAALADAPTAEVIRSWSGLGYNRRAVNLQRAAQAVVERHGGEMPADLAALRSLPGVGRYTAGAVACFAFGRDVGFLDTNIRRVLHRLAVGPELPEPLATDREIQQLADRLVPPGAGYTWNQALIEFGALQCTARRPACVTCPLQGDCRAYPAIQAALGDARREAGTGRQPREGAFAGSSRYYRGRVIAALRDLGDGEAIDLDALGPRVRPDYGDEHVTWLRDVVEGLRRDGLAEVAEEHAGYDATAPAALRVRLP
ncbi:MAG TPA: A/G-specific adenine glycosylase [Thermomicrobiaceae bacterium]|nr:A/G-specific adenine glycosylase [Thermomicrobiaceae bacterium]